MFLASSLMRKLMIFSTTLMVAAPALATQLALVDRDVGHAMLFQHRGNCFAVLPSHVAVNDRFSLELPLQRVVGSGTAFLRDTANDIAIAYVEGGVTAYCHDQWDSFDRDLRSLLETRTRGEIVRLSPEGIQDRADAQIFAVTPEMVIVRTTDNLADGQIYQGNSGSVLEVDGRVVGIAQAAISGREARFFRMDEILRRVGPQLGGGLAARHPDDLPPPDGTDGAQGFRVTGWTGAAGGTGAASLEPGLLSQAFVSPWSDEPVQIEITLDPASPVPLAAINLRSDPGAAPDQSPPKTVLFEVDAGAPGRPFWRSLGQRDMPPNGVFAYQTGGIFARRVRVTIQSMWFADRQALRIDGLTVE